MVHTRGIAPRQPILETTVYDPRWIALYLVQLVWNNFQVDWKTIIIIRCFLFRQKIIIRCSISFCYISLKKYHFCYISMLSTCHLRFSQAIHCYHEPTKSPGEGLLHSVLFSFLVFNKWILNLNESNRNWKRINLYIFGYSTFNVSI